ncbi:MAG: VWA domain-containing protein [Bacteroidia bacterium]
MIYGGRIIFFLFLMLLALNGHSQSSRGTQKTRILFLLDASGSMYGKWENAQKITAAKSILTALVDSLRYVENVELALRVYGHTSPKGERNCKDTKLEVPFGRTSASEIITKLREIVPRGTTPIAYSLTQAANDFPDASTKNIIILITDGIEECDGDPCAVSVALQKKGVILRPFIIGLGLNTTLMAQFDCVGKFYNAEDPESFKTVLEVVVSHALNNTTAQVNLLDQNGKPTETNVNMTFYDRHNNILINNLYHTMNERGNPDTLTLDPNISYNIQVNTIPPVYKNDVNLTPGKHNVIAIDAPQGDLELKVKGITNYDKLLCVIKPLGRDKILHVQDFNTKEKYIVGKYDIEILCLPRIRMREVEIKQSFTTTIEIPQPGKLSLSSYKDMIGSIYMSKGAGLEWVYNIQGNLRREIIALQPGTYQLVYRFKYANQSFYTKQVQFTISSGGSTQLNIN